MYVKRSKTLKQIFYLTVQQNRTNIQIIHNGWQQISLDIVQKFKNYMYVRIKGFNT